MVSENTHPSHTSCSEGASIPLAEVNSNTSSWTSAHLRCSSSVNRKISTLEGLTTNDYGDDIYFPVPRAPVTGILGGAGSYAALGARLFRKPPESHKISWTVHLGSDFPDNLRQEIDSWETSCNFISTPERLTTQSLNIYGENEYRGITPKLRLTAPCPNRWSCRV